MHKNIFIDHMYTDDKNHKYLKKLEKAGFILDKKEVEHPGRAFCRFIKLENRQYLEFVNVKKGGNPHVSPGFSLGYKNNLKNYYKSISKKVDFRVGFFHKNYDWKNDDKSNLPGWNFVTFSKLGFRTFFPWMTEYEPRPNEKNSNKDFKLPKHPNTVYGLYGVEFKVNEAAKKFFSKVLFIKAEGSLSLAKGSKIIFSETGRPSRFERVILKCRNFKKAKEKVSF